MLNKTIKLLTTFTLIVLLTLQPIPIVTFAEQSNDKQPSSEDQHKVSVFSEEDDEIALYIEPSESSEIVSILDNEDEVIILERLEDFSYVQLLAAEDESEIEESPDEEIVYGYIKNSFIQENHDDSVDDAGINGKENEENEVNDAEDESVLNSDEESDGDPVEESTDETGNTEDESDPASEVLELETVEESNAQIQAVSLNITQITLYGLALKDKTHVYRDQSKSNGSLKSYNRGSKLKFKTLNNSWYEARVNVNGKWETGYIHVNDVELLGQGNQKTYYGVALKGPTHIFSRADTGSKSLKSYPVGSILKYKSLSENWYEATVRVKGKWEKGYIRKSHVENKVDKQETLYGIGTQNPTRVYARASTNAKAHKSYPQGSILKYKTFSKDWYEATVRVKGKWETGYIYKDHVENKVDKQETLYGIGTQSPTKIFTRASTDAKTHKTYAQGSILKYKTFTKDWFEATVRVNGEWVNGYIHKDHVENKVEDQQNLYGVALNKSTKVFTRASTSAKELKSYSKGSILRYKSFAKDWYEATVYVNGHKKTGYIHKDHVGQPNAQINLEGFALKDKTHVYDRPFSNANSLKSYDKDSLLKFKTYANNWYEARVKIDGEWQTGYIYYKDVTNERKTKYDYTFKKMIDVQMKGTPKADGAGNINATRGLVEFFANPLNFLAGTVEYYQFLVLSKPANLNAKLVNDRVLHDKGSLRGTAAAFISAGKRYNINEAYLIAHALHETGNGKSSLAEGIPVDKNGKVTRNKNGDIAKTSATKHTVYNMYGYGAYDTCPIDCGAEFAFNKGWFTIEESIIGGAGNIVNYINRGQDTLYKMRWNPIDPGYPQYATHVQWATAQTKRIFDLYQLLGDATIIFDVPEFDALPNYSSGVYGIVNVNNVLNVREGPGTSHDAIGTLPNKAEIQILGSNPNGWYHIKSNNLNGWVSATYINLIY